MPLEQTAWRHDWPLAPWSTILLLLLLVGLLYWCYRADRRSLIAWQWVLLLSLRLAAVLGIFLAAWGWQRVRYQTELPKLLVMVDLSASMSEPDGVEGVPPESAWRRRLTASSSGSSPRQPALSRLEVVRLLLGKQNGWLRRASRHYEIRFFTADEQLVPRASDIDSVGEHMSGWMADGKASRLGTAIEQAVAHMRGLPTAGIIFFTDGAVTGGPSLPQAAESASRAQIPLFFVGLGRKEPVRDLQIESVAVDSPVFLGDQVRIDVAIRRSGDIGGTTTLELREGSDGPVVVSRQVDLDSMEGDTTTIRLWFEATQVGTRELMAQLAPHDLEANPHNNRFPFTLEVRDVAVRVLLVASRPSWEFRFLKQLLARTRANQHAAVELTTVQQDADPEYADQDATAQAVVPVNQDELWSYDVIVLLDADLGRMGNSTIRHLRAFVETKGGGLVIAAGPRFFPATYQSTPLAELLPADVDQWELPSTDRPLTDLRAVQPSPLGRRHSALRLEPADDSNQRVWESLPPLRWLATSRDLRPDAWILLETVPSPGRDAEPVMVWRYFGAGSVVFLATDETFLWSRYRGDDRYYQRFWMQLVRELGRWRLEGGSGSARLLTDRREYRSGDLVTVRLRMTPAGSALERPIVEWRSDDGRRGRVGLERHPDEPEWFEGHLSNLPPGRYELELAQPLNADAPVRASFRVQPSFGEDAHRQRDDRAMRLAARAGKGGVYEADAVGKLVDALPRVKPTRVAALPPEPFWNRWPWLLLLVAALLAEWTLRRRWSLA